eukprot:7203669-Pyramimonas_sp.AAC.1
MPPRPPVGGPLERRSSCCRRRWARPQPPLHSATRAFLRRAPNWSSVLHLALRSLPRLSPPFRLPPSILSSIHSLPLPLLYQHSSPPSPLTFHLPPLLFLAPPSLPC